MSRSDERSAGLSRFDLAPLRHPMFWGALAVLLVNDDLLKGRGLAPAWVTGKLSDFAFLIVAPLVFAALLPRILPGRRTLALVSVVGLYVACDLSPAISDAVVALAARLGFVWRLWPDPTDLIALAVLPCTIYALRGPHRPRAARDREPGLRERVGLVVGALACVATSAPLGDRHHPFFVNRTSAPVDLRVTWLLRKVDCATSPETLASTLDSNDLDDPRTLKIATGQVAVLEGQANGPASPVGECDLGHERPIDLDDTHCVAAILETSNATPVVMVARPGWLMGARGGCSSQPDTRSRCKPSLAIDHEPGPDAVSLTGSNRRLAFEGTRSPSSSSDAGAHDPRRAPVRIAPIDVAEIAARSPASDGCRAMRDAYHALLESNACSSDADCQVLEAAAIPGETTPCGAYVNRNLSAQEARDLSEAWRARCVLSAQACPTLQPPACHDGTCGEMCPGVSVPICLKSCRDYETRARAAGLETCGYDPVCFDDSGRTCACRNDAGTVSGEPTLCHRTLPAAPGCSLTCLPANDRGHGASTAGLRDAGADRDAGR